MPHVFVLGRFPPPLDGQTLATRRLAELLEGPCRVTALNTQPDARYLPAEPKLRLDRLWRYARMRRGMADRLRSDPAAPVLWASVSPSLLGHWRDVLVTLPALAPGQPAYAVVHRGTFEQIFLSPLKTRSARRMAERLDGFVFLNRELADACAPWIPEAKRFVIPNTIDALSECSPAEVRAKQEDRMSRRGLRLLFLSNMMPEKGYLDVLAAVAVLVRGGVPVTATFAGAWMSDADRHAFERFVAQNGLARAVEHLGPVSDRARVKALHLAADVLLLPSYHPTEAQPLTLIEALSAGTPVIVTRQGGLPDIVGDAGAGDVVPPRDPEAIARSVQAFLDPARWRSASEAARRRFEERFSPNTVRALWLRLLSQT